MHIGILQTGHAPDALRPALGDYSDLFQSLLDGRGFEFTTFDVVDMAFPDGPDAAEGWLITGSRHGAYEEHPFIPPLEALIRDIHAAGRPLVGICFGHQIIAQALGGRVEKAPGGWVVGRQAYRWGDEEVALNAWHQDQVVALPEGAERIATSPACRNAAYVIGPHVFGVQAHPEFDDRFIEGLIEHRGDAIPPELRDEARAGLGRGSDSAALADHIARVLQGGGAA
ncbi:glutamine amidotransferase, class I [Oceanicola granulosus HTCC2516]|uniref:Glutamine amidotransferase, class I n=1 Tax=Oceanicola granulosus (strain ATCC BAA-861 / DSM 15982 / KCTC 12143 / HTCC2516) TaxID=314256 RepID=Q2C9T8_OCEGH|nr:type 1 glutamine amidotransferase [Oceanicola granulosus]EAR49433.1 glutamine amidotransferase, class I [Oceanicola granulosus HTCC2516]